MPSNARLAFDGNVADIKRLLEFHEEKGGTAPGRRYGLEVLNKSAIVLITSYWEAYCEDIAAEGLPHLVEHLPTAEKLPKDLKKQIAKELELDKNEIAVWALTDDGWRDLLKKRLRKLQADRNRRLNTPKSTQIDELFRSALGVSRMSDSWKWVRLPADKSRKRLDKFVELRGAIAHRGKAAESVKKKQVQDYFDFVKRLAGRTGGEVNKYVRAATGKSLW